MTGSFSTAQPEIAAEAQKGQCADSAGAAGRHQQDKQIARGPVEWAESVKIRRRPWVNPFPPLTRGVINKRHSCELIKLFKQTHRSPTAAVTRSAKLFTYTSIMHK